MKRNIIQLLSIALAMLSMSVWGDNMIYKCKNQQGNINYQKSACTENAETVSSWVPAKEKLPEKKTRQELIVKQSGNGHYFLEGAVNNKTLAFVIDTGASIVSLPSAIALDAGISCKDQIVLETANGSTGACTTTIQKLKFGPFVVKDALATIVPNLSQPLLGMNILQHFNMAQANGEMRISARD
jgi:clan AA aspartic protease (TIGR02281 family)